MHRVLVVDGNPHYRFLVATALRGSELAVVAEAGDEASALAQAAAVALDIVVIDPLLPGDPSLALVSQLQAMLPTAAVVVTSAYPEEELWLGPPSPTASFLSKATSPVHLAGILQERLAAARGCGDGATVEAEHRSFPGESRSAGAARRFAREVLDGWGCDDEAIDAVVLLISEVVTNAVIHAGTTVDVSLVREPDHVRVEVGDRDSEYIRRRDAGADDQSGRGMGLIETLTSAWGIDERPEGKAVWFEVPVRVRA